MACHYQVLEHIINNDDDDDDDNDANVNVEAGQLTNVCNGGICIRVLERSVTPLPCTSY